MNRGLSAYSAQSEDEEQHSSMHKARASLQSEELGIVGAAASNIALVSPPPPPPVNACRVCPLQEKVPDRQKTGRPTGENHSKWKKIIFNCEYGVCKTVNSNPGIPLQEGGSVGGFFAQDQEQLRVAQ